MGTSNGTAWILNESVGLQAAAVEVARVVGLPIHLKRLSASGIVGHLPAFVQQRLPPERLLEGLATDKTFSAWPALIIAAGGKSGPVALVIKRLAPNRMFALKVQKGRAWTPSFDLVLQNRTEEPERGFVSFDATYNVSPVDCRCAGLSDRAISDANLIGQLIKRTLGLES
jgi:mitochondrial fission protein ELM1